MHMKTTGSLSVFFAMILPLMLSFCFGMLEVTRICGLDRNSQELAQQMAENAFSEYQPVLWKRYGILALDMGYATEKADPEKISERMLTLGSWQGEDDKTGGIQYFLGVVPELCQIKEYGLLTDDFAAPLIRQGAEAAKEIAAEKMISQWTGAAQQTEELQESGPQMKDLVDRGKQALSEQESSAEDRSMQGQPLELQYNPFELFSTWNELGLLALIFSSDTQLSEKTIDRQNVVSRRTRMQGTETNLSDIGLTDRILFGQYLLNTFSDYTSDQSSGRQDGTGLVYETEYVIGGKMTDRKNLESVAIRILALREIQNIAAIYMDSVKMQQTQSAALAIAGFTSNPVIIQAVRAAVAAVWAFVESVLDVRRLFEGGTVPVVKNSTEWTSDLMRLGEYFPPDRMAKDSGQGMTYSDYLRIFLTLLPKEDLGLRACDVMELNIRSVEGYENVHADHLIYMMKASCSYQGTPVFSGRIGLREQDLPVYSFAKQVVLSYER